MSNAKTAAPAENLRADDQAYLELSGLLNKLDRCDLLVVDNLGYIKKSEAKTSVLFELAAHYYEHKSLI